MPRQRQPLVEPLQQRSRQTLSQLLEATQSCLSSSSWERVTVREIVEAAGSSVGSFYARFPNKEALLDHLDECYAEEFVATFALAALREEASGGLAECLNLLAHRLRSFYRGWQGVARALVLRARALREPACAARTSRMNQALEGVYEFLLEDAAAIAHPDPASAVRFAFNLIFFPLRERILFPETIEAAGFEEDAVYASELARAAHAYLCAPVRTEDP